MSDAAKELGVFLIIMLLLGITWFKAGGFKSGNLLKPFLSPPAPLGTGATYGDQSATGSGNPFPSSAKRTPENSATRDSTDSTKDSTAPYTKETYSQIKRKPTAINTQSPPPTTVQKQNLTDVQTDFQTALKEKELNGQFSVYKGRLIISQVSTSEVGSSGEVNESVRLSVSGSAGGKIPLTGMVLKSLVSGNSATIAGGAVVPNPNDVNATETIFLSAGDNVYILTGRSPNGLSFRLNKCIGYLGQNQTYNPSLPNECPLVRNEALPQAPNALNDACLNYLQGIGSCQIVANPPGTQSHECQQFVIERTNYNWCLSKHRNDSDFFKNEWRVYLGRGNRLWKNSREVIRLIDQDGKIVYETTY
jgi:hypothetical protein